MEKCMQLLVGEKNFDMAIVGDSISAADFAENILGFEEVDENELDQDEEEADYAAAGKSYASGSPSKYLSHDAIPEEQH